MLACPATISSKTQKIRTLETRNSHQKDSWLTLNEITSPEDPEHKTVLCGAPAKQATDRFMIRRVLMIGTVKNQLWRNARLNLSQLSLTVSYL